MFRFLFKTILFGFLMSALILTALYFTPQEYYKKAIVWVVKEKTGSDLEINGDMKLTPLDKQVFTVSNVKLSNNPEPQAKLVMDFGSLTFFRDGVQLDRISVAETKVNYVDPAIQADYLITDINSDIRVPMPGQPMTIVGDAIYKGERVAYDLKIDDPEKLKDERGSAIALQINNEFLNIDYRGKQSTEDKKGQLKVNLGSIKRLSTWMGGNDKIDGTGVIDLNFEIRGNDVSTLNGNSSIIFSNLVQGYTDPGINHLISLITKNTMEIKQLTATFDIKNGIITNNDLRGEGPTVFTGSGTINLVDETIDYKIVPDVRITTVASVPNLSPPISIKGTLKNPVITVEAADVLNQVIQKPEELIKTITDLTTNNADGKQIKKDLQGLRNTLIKDPTVQNEVLKGLLGTEGAATGAQIMQGIQKPKEAAPVPAPTAVPSVPVQQEPVAPTPQMPSSPPASQQQPSAAPAEQPATELAPEEEQTGQPEELLEAPVQQ